MTLTNKFEYWTFKHQPWTVGKIEGSQTEELDARVEDLIFLYDTITEAIQIELDFIHDVVARRDVESKT